MDKKRIGCISGNSRKSKNALYLLLKNYNFIDLKQYPESVVDSLIVLGGDGFMLHILHQFMDREIEFYGMNCGTIGFLMNRFSRSDVIHKVSTAKLTRIHPLKMTAYDRSGTKIEALAVNEVALFRQTNQVAKIRILVDNIVRMEELIGDGVMVSTSAGSSAYNSSAGGSIIPIGSNLLCLTPISPFRPKRWRGAILPNTTKITFEIIEDTKRPVSAVADFHEARDVVKVEIEEYKDKDINLLFEINHSLEDRIIREQFN